MRRFVTNLPLERFGCIVDLSTLLIDQLQPTDRSFAHSVKSGQTGDYSDVGDKNETLIANLLHLLLCLRTLAYASLIKIRMSLLMPIITEWYSEWDKEQLSHQDGWKQQEIANRNQMGFAEWPGRRPPLSTTWPWLVKPSLMVLWGVCWMFYADNGYPPNAAEQDGHTHRAHPLELRQTRPSGQQGTDFGESSLSFGFFGKIENLDYILISHYLTL